MLQQYCNALGWQGGTHTQVVREIERLKLLESETTELLSQLAFQQGNGKLRMHKLTQDQCAIISKILGKHQ